MPLNYKNITLKRGQDRQITRREAREILGVSNATLTNLREELPPVERRNGNRPEHTYSLRMVLELKDRHPFNTKQQERAKGKRTERERKRCARPGCDILHYNLKYCGNVCKSLHLKPWRAAARKRKENGRSDGT